jgi:hypothetical protein
MSRKKAQFITEHMIPETEVNRKENWKKTFTYKIIHHKKVYWDESLVLALPFDSVNLMVPKFWAAVEFYKSQCPEFFEETLRTRKRYDWTAIVQSNAEKYNKRF